MNFNLKCCLISAVTCVVMIGTGLVLPTTGLAFGLVCVAFGVNFINTIMFHKAYRKDRKDKKEVSK